MVKKIVAIGPESTGKSTLCQQLALRYKTSWCKEFAREYLLSKGAHYQYDDLVEIAKGQLALEDEMTKKLEEKRGDASSFLFIDTNMYVMKVWCEFVFGKCPAFVLDQIAMRHYDFYLLCDTDIPWQADELREYPDLATRQTLFRMYKEQLVNQSTPWTIISGNPEERLERASQAIQKNFY